MLKKFIALLLAVILLTTAIPVFAFEYEEEDYVQIRAAAEAQGWIVDWDAELRKVILTAPNGDEFYVDVEESGSFIVNGRVYVSPEIMEALFFLYEAIVAIPDNPNIHGKLTRIEYGDNVAYLFGSMHASMPHWFPLVYFVEEAMERSDVFVFEVDMAEFMNMTEEQEARIEELQILPDGLTLEDILDEDVFENFITNLETFSAIGIDYELVADLTPVALVSALESVMMMILGLDLVFSIDAYISMFAEENDRPILGLNSIMNELDIVFDMPLEIQAYALIGFPDFDTMLEAFEDTGLIELYETQDIEGIREMLQAGAAAGEGNPYSEYMLYNMMYVRDNIFAEEIARLLRETEEPTTFFITMGLAHLIRDYGFVFEFLEEKGFELESLWNL
ncbi:MAG: TraB/GumN family protein [Defluviitaleaceae bacterium]|nr:TraB/GumN family protein [Defluviitaleaceae bacterium]